MKILPSLIEQIKNHLALAGLKTSIEARKKLGSIDSLIHEPQIGTYIIYVIQEEEESKIIETLENTLPNTRQKQFNPLFLWLYQRKREKDCEQFE